MVLVNANLIYVTEEKKTHGKTSCINDLILHIHDNEVAHTTMKKVLDFALLLYLMTLDFASL